MSPRIARRSADVSRLDVGSIWSSNLELALVMVKADGTSKEVKLEKGHAIIGRDEAARIRIPLGAVSRKHCEIKIEDDEVVVQDLGSSNGTYVNGKRVKQAELAPGDLLGVGPVVFVVRIGCGDGIDAGLRKSGRDVASEFRVVVDYQDTHG